MPKTSVFLAAALVLGAVIAGYVVSRDPVRAPPQAVPAIGVESASSISSVADPAAPTSSAREPNEPPARRPPTNEERVVAIKRAIGNAMADSRDAFAEELSASGLAAADGQQIAQRFVDQVADCIFEAARTEYEAHGVGFTEFLDGAEIVWTQPVEMDVRNLGRVQTRAAPCIANASQQAGTSVPIDETAAEIAERLSADLESPPWGGEMETRIRDHIASHPELALSGTLVKCRNDGCNVMLVGRDIRIFDLEFDVFAEQNGFRHAVLGGDANRRFVWLQR